MGKHSKRNNTALVLLCTATLVFAGGCQNKNRATTDVARIDNTRLTLEEILARLDTTRNISDTQIHAFVQRWITDELFYREAVRRGLDQKPAVAQHLDDIRRQLVINALLEQEVYNTTSAEFTPEEIRTYYEAHQKEFVLTNDVALVSMVLFVDREAANTFRTSVLRGKPWGETLRSQLNDPPVRAGILSHTDSTYFTQQTLFPTALWRAAAGIGVKAPSFHIQTENGYYVLIVWSYGHQGQKAELPYVEKEIRGRLTIERRQHLYTALLENLRSKHAVEVLVAPNASTRDTTTQKAGE